MRKIPTVLGLILVVVLVGVVALTTSVLKNATSGVFTKADAGTNLILPVTTANVTASSFSVYWISEEETPSAVFYGQSESLGDGVGVDERDLANPNGRYKTHFVRVTGLKPDTKYYFRIGDGEKSSITTKASDNQIIEPIYGKVTDGGGAALDGAIAVLAEKYAALSKNDGSFVVPAVGIDSATKLTLIITTAEGSATVTCKAGKDQPFPTVKIGENLDCDKNSSGSQPRFTAPNLSVSSAGGQLEVSLKEKETVNTPLPTISGKAGPNQKVQIEVHSNETYTAEIKADPAGNWSWTPPANLEPGIHTATITVTNADGTTQSITRTFYVSANAPILPITSGTPSGELSHYACVDQACTKIEGSGTDSCQVDADCAPPPAPEPEPEPEPPPPAPAPPPTGIFENTLIILIGGATLTLLGLVTLISLL